MVDVKDMCKTNEELKKKLKGLRDLSDYKKGKLGLYNNETYVSWNYFQGLQRSYYGESIDSLIPFLYSNINDYCIFFNMIIYATKVIIDENDLAYIIELHNENEKKSIKKIFDKLVYKFQKNDNDINNSINILLDNNILLKEMIKNCRNLHKKRFENEAVYKNLANHLIGIR